MSGAALPFLWCRNGVNAVFILLGSPAGTQSLRFSHLSHGGRGRPFRTIPAGSPGPPALWIQKKDGAAIPTPAGHSVPMQSEAALKRASVKNFSCSLPARGHGQLQCSGSPSRHGLPLLRPCPGDTQPPPTRRRARPPGPSAPKQAPVTSRPPQLPPPATRLTR